MKPKLLCLLLNFCFSLTYFSYAQSGNTIVFSKNPIDATNPAGLTDQFNTGDNIYAYVAFDKSLIELSRYKTAKKITVEVFIYELKPPLYDYQQPSENQLITGSLNISGDALKNKFIPIDILPSVNALTSYGSKDLEYKKFGPKFDGPVKFAEELGKLEPGEHKIIVKLMMNDDFAAEGRFVFKGSDFAQYNKLSDELNEAASNIETKDALMPKATLSDKKLEAEMNTAFKASQTYKERVNGEILRIVIIDPDWIIRRNELTGIILHRYIRAFIAVKNSDSSCTVWKNVTFQQDYIGNKFAKIKFDGMGDPYKMPCENINK